MNNDEVINDMLKEALTEVTRDWRTGKHAFRALAAKHKNAAFSHFSIGIDSFVVTVDTMVNTPTIQQWFTDVGMMVIRIDTTNDPVFVVYFKCLRT